MNRVVSRVLVLLFALLLTCSAILAGEQAVPTGDLDAMTPHAKASASGSGIELALLSIVLGGSMIYLFRPKRKKNS
jgi:hypothetical protein